MGLKVLNFQSIGMFRELDGDSQCQPMFLAFLGILVLHGLGPDTKTSAVITYQSANIGRVQCGLVPNLSMDSDFDLVGLERIGIILEELDSAVGEWPVGVKEKRAIGKGKLEGGFGSILWTTASVARPVRVVPFRQFL